MKKLKIGIIDLVSKGPNNSAWARLMFANLASIMPTVVAKWCEDHGHDVTFVCYTGRENLIQELPDKPDVVFISAFTQAAQVAYALSNLFKSQGAITILGGPHARCFPQDSTKYFDYVLGFTDKELIGDLLRGVEPQKHGGLRMAAKSQPKHLPGVHERWKFIEPTLAKAPYLKIVPLIGSMGCPYTCSFCIDSTIDYEPMDYEVITDELKFLQTKYKSPFVVWHDPNFGIRFNETLEVIEKTIPNNNFRFIAESSLALLKEDNLKRLQKTNFVAMLPGVETWFDLGGKSKTGKKEGLEKVRQVSDHINLIMKYIPYTQSNFVFGLDSDEGTLPFELTKKFVDLSPGTFPGYSHLTAFGQAAPLNLSYMRENRVLPFPFHLLNNHHAMNVKPKNYTWAEFYDNVIDVTEYTFSKKNIWKRFRHHKHPVAKWMNVVRAVSQEGWGRVNYFKEYRRRIDTDFQLRDFIEGQSTVIPEFFESRIKHDLGDLWEWLPEGALLHDPNAYLKEEEKKVPQLVNAG